jgi:hypothetical protein
MAESKYPVYFNGSSHPYHKKLTLAQAKGVASNHMDKCLKAVGFKAFVSIMNPVLTGKYGISIYYGNKTE